MSSTPDALAATERHQAILQDLSDSLEAGYPGSHENPIPLAPDFSEVIRRIREVLTVAEIAEITGVKDRQVHHWASGSHNPQGETRDKLLSLYSVVSNLVTTMSPSQAQVWFWTPSNRISGRPADLMREGDSNRVIRLSREITAQDPPDDPTLVRLARQGNSSAADLLIKRYSSFVRLKASSYFLVGGDADDLFQEGLLGLHKAIRGFPLDGDTSFRNFAELCITRQIITAVKTATRNSHFPLSRYLSSHSAESVDEAEAELSRDSDASLEQQAISSEELTSLVETLRATLSEMESSVLGFYLEDRSYEDVAAILGVETKTVDQALQRVKKKVNKHLEDRPTFS